MHPRLIGAVTAALVLIASAVALAPSAGAEGYVSAHPQRIAQRSCFWTERLAAKFDTDPEENFAFPDTGAAYWTSKSTMPAGAHIVLRGKYAHARYQSLNSYDAATATPLDAVNDVSTKPDRGSRNPYLPGARRDLPMKRRKYSVSILDEPVPGTPAQNTLYAGVDGQEQVVIFYRVYLPEPFRKHEQTGGAGLPKVELHLADGTVLKNDAACQALRVEPGRLTLDALPPDVYRSIREQPGKPATFPAEPIPLFRTFYSRAWGLGCWYGGDCTGQPERVGGQYSNVDNEYIASFVNRGFPAGPVLVLRGKLPRTPDTGRDVERMPRGQLRYWSICQNESVLTTASSGCLYDVQIPVDRKGRYTIVTSKAEDRPPNVRRKCGVAYLPWPERGDGAGHLDDGLLIVRNMLPAKSFHHAIQDTSTPGDESRVLGPYMPRGTYTTEAEFSSRGC